VFYIKKEKRIAIRINEEDKVALEAEAKKKDTNISSVVSSAIEQYLDGEKAKDKGLTYLDLSYKLFPKLIECFENSGMAFVTLLTSQELSLLTMIEKKIPLVFLFSTRKLKSQSEQIASDFIEVKIFADQMDKTGSALFTLQIVFQTGMLETSVPIIKNEQSEIDLNELEEKINNLIEGLKIAYDSSEVLFNNLIPDDKFIEHLTSCNLRYKVSQDYNEIIETMSAIKDLKQILGSIGNK